MFGLRSKLFLLSVVCLVLCSASSYAVPISVFSGVVDDWFLRTNAPLNDEAYLDLGRTFQVNGGLFPSGYWVAFDYQTNPSGIVVNRTPIAQDPGVWFGNLHFSGATFAFVDTFFDLKIETGPLAGDPRATFRVQLVDMLVQDSWDAGRRLGSSSATINGVVDYTEMILLSENLPDDFDPNWAIYGDFVMTLQATGLTSGTPAQYEGTLTGHITGALPGAAILGSVIELTQGDKTSASFTATTSDIPEPTSLALVGAGLLSLAAAGRRRARR